MSEFQCWNCIKFLESKNSAVENYEIFYRLRKKKQKIRKGNFSSYFVGKLCHRRWKLFFRLSQLAPVCQRSFFSSSLLWGGLFGWEKENELCWWWLRIGTLIASQQEEIQYLTDFSKEIAETAESSLISLKTFITLILM